MHDALTLEKRGIPAVLICTRPFVHTAEVMAGQMGLSEYPMVVIEHPIGRLDDDGLQDRIDQAKTDALAIISEPLSV